MTLSVPATCLFPRAVDGVVVLYLVGYSKHEHCPVVSHLNGLPAPLSVFGVVGQSPHVHVALDDFWSQDVVSVAQPGRRGFAPAVKSERLRSQFGG